MKSKFLDDITPHAYNLKYWRNPSLIVTVTSVLEISSKLDSGSAESGASDYSGANS